MDYNEMKAIAAHCYVHLYQLDLAKIVTLLKPLENLGLLKDDKSVPYPGDPESSFLAAVQRAKSLQKLGKVKLSKFIIDSLFDALIKCMRNQNDAGDQLQKWFHSYRNMVS